MVVAAAAAAAETGSRAEAAGNRRRSPLRHATPAAACKQDEARLAKIRANPSLADLAALERELSCERLRPQIVRLRESLPKEARPKDAPDQPRLQPIRPSCNPLSPRRPRRTRTTGLIVQVRSCDEERATLAKLRASQSREDVVQFERELACEQLRPQVIRLRESLSGG